MSFLNLIQSGLVILDGGMGTLLQEKGLMAGERSEEWNLSHPNVIKQIHKAYFEAGSNVVCANTFGANPMKYSSEKLEEIIFAALTLAKEAKEECQGEKERFVALDIGSLGRLLKPLGDLDFEAAVSAFAQVVRLGEKYGADLIFIETMTDTLETKAALLAAKEISTLPVLVSNAYDEKGELLTGADPGAVIALLEGMGADAIGVNCSRGPKELASVAEKYLALSSLPVIFKPNAGLPRSENGKTVFSVTPEEFAREVALQVEAGVRIVGGCCGTTPEHIRALKKALEGKRAREIQKKKLSCISSYTQAVYFGEKPVLIGERINPTGKKKLKEALREKNMEYILSQAIGQEEGGAHVLDVNVGLPEIDEGEMLLDCVRAIQGVTALPLQIDTASPEAMEKALRAYNGKAMINSVNGKKESMEAIFPLVKKYGGFVVALTLDENGIPEKAQGRVEIAKKILACAKEYGLSEKDLIFDPLTMPVSANPKSALITIEALERIRKELGCLTCLGVSNISFGLPQRNALNGAFFTMALQKGLNAAILNPASCQMMTAYHTHLALSGKDENFEKYLHFAPSLEETGVFSLKVNGKEEEGEETLCRAIEKGRSALAASLTARLLEEKNGLDVVKDEIIPALDLVGKGFEKGSVYLPQLLMSAEAAQSAFEKIRDAMHGETCERGMKVVLATVKGDIHDIGKNILHLLLENYGFSVLDLGKDVSPEGVLAAVLEHNVPLVGLSALMTTTVPAMEKTILLLKEKAPFCKIMVGGAVLTEEYAKKIGADFYGADAMSGVRIAEKVQKEQ